MNTIHPRAGVSANFRSTHRARNRARIIVACAVGPIVAALSPSARAAVHLSSVAAGSATVSQQGAITTIRTGTNNTILYFSKFDIAGGSTVNFVQPSVAGRVLDHVTSATPSLINGTIQSNGSVFLINPAGVIFGAGAVVDVNRFYAAAANFSDQDFLSGINHFSGATGMVSNNGTIRANQVSLIGSQVMNAGNIIAPNGYVAMLAGSDVLVSEQGSHITAKVASAMPVLTGSNASAPKTGSAAPDLHSSAMAAGDVYSLAIRHTGNIQAANVLINGGSGQVQISGSIDASSHVAGGVGGSVAITGGEVDLVSANINASGPAGGGSVDIGGGPHGSGDLTHAQIVNVDSSSTIDADAITNGPGGSIVLWSGGTTSDAATLTARGGAIGGDGGYIETSGDYLQVTAAPNASAPHGAAGLWLMDPINITIENGTDDGNLTGPVVFNQTIVDALNAGTNVAIDTSNQTNGVDTGTLIQNSDAPIAVTPTTSVTLTLRANADMTLSGGITASGIPTLSVELDQLNSAGNKIQIDTNPININGTFTVVGGNFTLAAASTLTAAGVTIGAGTVTADSGSIALTMGSVNINAPVITNGGTFSITNATSVTSIAGGTINTSGSTNGEVDISANGPISLVGAITTGTTTLGGGVFLDFGTSGAPVAAPSGTIAVGGAVGTFGGVFSAGGTTFTSTAAITTATGNVTLHQTGAQSIGAAISTGGGTFTATGGTSFSTTATTGSITTANGNVSITATTGGVTIGAPVNTGTGAFAVTTSGLFEDDATITGGSAAEGFTVNTSTGAGTINITGAITWAGTAGVDIEGAGALTISSTGSIAPTISGAAVPISLFTTGIAAALGVNGSITTGGVFTASGGNFALGATGGLTAGSASINLAAATTLDAKTVTPDAVAINAPVATKATTGIGFETGGISFASNSTGTITSSGGDISLTTISTGITVGAEVDTNGGAFTAVAISTFENDAAIKMDVTNKNAVFKVTTTGSGSININGAISWAGTGGVLIFGPNQVSTTALGTITNAGSAVMPVSLFTTTTNGAPSGTTGITVGGVVTTNGAFIASGGNFILSSNIGITAASISLNLPAMVPTTPTATATTPATVTIEGPLATTAGNGAIDIGGTISVIDNTTATIKTMGGDVVISNPGDIALGNEIDTNGGAFTDVSSSNLTASSAPINTSGGNVSITTTTTDGAEISTGSPVNTLGGSFTVTGQAFTSNSTITDGGVATANGVFSILNGSSGTGTINIVGSVVWTGGVGRSVLVEGGGDVEISGITSGGLTPLPVSLYTTGIGNTITVNGPVVTSGAFIGAGGAFSVIAGGSVTAQSLAINTLIATPDAKPLSPGAVSIAGPIISNGTVFTASGPSFASSGTGTITTNGGDVDLITTGAISVGAAINTGGGAFNATADNAFASTVGGTITTTGGAVTINSLGNIGQGTGEINLGDEINTGGGSFSSNATTFTSSGEITDGGINGGQSVNITTTGGDITLNTGGDINWAASLGSLTFIVPTGSNLALGANITANVAEPINLSGVTLSLVGVSAPATVSGGSITFGAIVNPDNTTSPALTVQSSSTISFAAVGTSASPIGTLTTTTNGSTAEPVATLSGDIFSTGDVIFGGGVVLATNVNITAADLATGTIPHTTEFAGTIEGPGGLTITYPVNVQSTEQIRFNNNIGDQTPLAFLNVNANSNGFVFFRAGPPGSTGFDLPGPNAQQPATVVDIASGGSIKFDDVVPSPKTIATNLATIDSYGPLTFNIGSPSTPNAANLFAVGQYEKITVYGSLAINTNGGTAQIEDISTFGDLSIDAANIVFVLRAATLDGTTALDSGMDLISNGEITLPAGAAYSTITPVAPGAFGVPGFIARVFNPNSNISSTASLLKTAISIVPSIPAEAFFDPTFNVLLDLTPATLGARLPTFIPPIPFVFDLPIAGAVPRQQLVAGTVTPDFKNAILPTYPGPIVQQDLNDNGVFTREPTLEEILQSTDSIVEYNDTPQKRRPRAEDFSVAVTRLNSRRVQEFLDQYREVFSGGSGNSANAPSRRAQMAADFQEAWDAYVSQNGYKRATGQGFQQYVARTPSASKVSGELTQLNSLFQQLQTLGLSDKEAKVAFQHNVLAGLPANGMQDGDLIAAVQSAGNP